MPNDSPSLPEWLGDFRIAGLLARGTMAEVYRGFSRNGRAVAIKVLDAALRDDADAVAGFEREAEALKAIHHPNVALLMDYGRTPDERPYLVFELVEGTTLMDIIERRERPELLKGLDWMEEAAEALQAAWFSRIIHRDIKPANLMIDPEGRLKVVDFGLSKSVFTDARAGAARGVMGTPRYMSPEMILGQSLDLRSDMYSLGATFFHYFTGESPFEADTPEQMMRLHAGSAPPPPHAIEPRLNDDISYILMRLMAKDPADRYESYDDLIDHLRKTRLALMSREGLLGRQAPPQPELRPDPLPYRAGSTPDSPLELSESEQAAQMDRRQRALSVSVEAPRHPIRRAALMLLGLCLLLGGLLWATGDPASPATAPERLRASIDRVLGALGFPASRTPDQPADWEEGDYRRIDANVQRMEDVMSMILNYRTDQGRLPDSLDELIAAGLLRRAETRDLWEREYEFYPGTGILYSYGEDGIQDTRDDFRLSTGMLWIARPRRPMGG
jgi:eukaryotic-like serine/threonine-protein kinase